MAIGKKILMLNYEFPPLGGGASPVSYEIAKGYAKLGHSVAVITMHYKGLKTEEDKEGIKIYRVKCLRKSNQAKSQFPISIFASLLP